MQASTAASLSALLERTAAAEPPSNSQQRLRVVDVRAGSVLVDWEYTTTRQRLAQGIQGAANVTQAILQRVMESLPAALEQQLELGASRLMR